MVAIADARLLHNFPLLEFPARNLGARAHAPIVYTLSLARAAPLPTLGRACGSRFARRGLLVPSVNYVKVP